MEWTAERNPDREYNFRIRELGVGRFAVVSDSERFGADQVVFESFRRGECVDYVTQRRDPGKWNYYVIEDLSSWIRGSENPARWNALTNSIRRSSAFANCEAGRKTTTSPISRI